jgi:Uma2 family endonuclease
MSAAGSITTLDQLLEQSGLGRCELIRGEVNMMSPAGAQHGWIVARITGPLVSHVESHDLGFVFGAETGFVLERNPDTVRAPDIAFIRRERLKGGPLEGYVPGAPDLAVEVLSPHDKTAEVHAKAETWLRAGAEAVWLVDPSRRMAWVASLCNRAYITQAVEALACDSLLPGFSLPLSRLFS